MTFPTHDPTRDWQFPSRNCSPHRGFDTTPTGLSMLDLGRPLFAVLESLRYRSSDFGRLESSYPLLPVAPGTSDSGHPRHLIGKASRDRCLPVPAETD
jgi:hypothetical protein